MERVKHRLYKCARCGYHRKSETNHKGQTYSWGHYSACPKCPPWAKYPEYGGLTTWLYVCEFVVPPRYGTAEILSNIQANEMRGIEQKAAWNVLAELIC